MRNNAPMANQIGLERLPCGNRVIVIDHGNPNPPDFNLWVEDAIGNELWRMDKVLKFPDAAVSFGVDSDSSFHFTTWNGLYFVIDINALETIERRIVK